MINFLSQEPALFRIDSIIGEGQAERTFHAILHLELTHWTFVILTKCLKISHNSKTWLIPLWQTFIPWASSMQPLSWGKVLDTKHLYFYLRVILNVYKQQLVTARAVPEPHTFHMWPARTLIGSDADGRYVQILKLLQGGREKQMLLHLQ